MKFPYYLCHIFLVATLPVFIYSCKSDNQWEGQGEIKKVNTETVPVARQYRGTFDLGNGIYMSNDFPGGRINGAILLNDSTVAARITPENTPINPSPWYAFKIWSKTPKKLSVKLYYPAGVTHRYYPNISKDGENWKKMDSSRVSLTEGSKNGILDLRVDKDTTWISAQELITGSQVADWTKKLENKSFITGGEIGKSLQNRPIPMMKIGEGDDQAMIVVLSRQHPPEVTGYKAMQAFVETISSDKEIAKKFRRQYNTYVIPMANPDGAANGNWRHNNGGIDLNRDWEAFNQPETAAIRDFFEKKVETTGGKIYFFVDFHSTFHDIFYTTAEELKGNMPGLVPELISRIGKEFKDYEPNIKPSLENETRITSTSYFFYNFGAESLTYEIGDNTSGDFIKQKGIVTAMKLMELMNDKNN